MNATEWAEKANERFGGRKIVDIRYLSKSETDWLGWDRSAPVLVLDDGSMLYPSSDDEGNNAGALFTTVDDLPTIPVVRL